MYKRKVQIWINKCVQNKVDKEEEEKNTTLHYIRNMKIEFEIEKHLD